MNSLFEQGENVASSPNGDDKRNPNAKGQSSNKVQMSKFKGHTTGLGAGDWRLETGDWRLETRDWGLETRDWRLETGDWGLGTGD
jgi:hypothetical protein